MVHVRVGDIDIYAIIEEGKSNEMHPRRNHKGNSFKEKVLKANSIQVSHLEIRKNIKSKDYHIYDFYIDEEYLPQKLKIGQREENMAFSNFDLDYIVIDVEIFPRYRHMSLIQRAVRVFLGQEKPFNQFGTDRTVLYRCHCGCDYCGVISFCLSVEDDFVYWKEIGYESDNSDIDLITDDLKFRKDEYEKAFIQYCKEVGI